MYCFVKYADETGREFCHAVVAARSCLEPAEAQRNDTPVSLPDTVRFYKCLPQQDAIKDAQTVPGLSLIHI